MAGKEISSLLDETENVMCDIQLSGYHSVRETSMERLKKLADTYEEYGMETGAAIVAGLWDALNMRLNSFDYDKIKITDKLSTLEFYMSNARSRLE